METCVGGECQDGAVPCATGDTCDDVTQSCSVDCLMDADCDDPVFCDRAETRIDCLCAVAAAPCASGEICDEENDAYYSDTDHLNTYESCHPAA